MSRGDCFVLYHLDYLIIFGDLSSKEDIVPDTCSEVEIGDVETNLIVVFKPEDGGTRVITAYPCKNIDKEVKAKEGKRWLKIK